VLWQPEDVKWMERAIALAQESKALPGRSPIGCVIVCRGKVVGEACNEVDLLHDATAHAEVLSMRRAGEKLQSKELRGAVLYTTLQPCGMCTMASIWAKISRIVYGAGRGDVHEMYFEDRHLKTEDFIRDAFKDDLSLEGGLMAKECSRLYVPPNADVPESQQFNR
jgi:tRNA(adenine34) deaminase